MSRNFVSVLYALASFAMVWIFGTACGRQTVSYLKAYDGELRIEVGADVIQVKHPSYLFQLSRSYGGLPTRIEWNRTGKVFATLRPEDRMYVADKNGNADAYWLRLDSQPLVSIEDYNGTHAVIVVASRYLNSKGDPTPDGSDIRAQYRYTFSSENDDVQVTGKFSRTGDVVPNELHFLQLHFHDRAFTEWIAGDPQQAGNLQGGNIMRGGEWGAIVDQRSMLSMYGTTLNRVSIWDGYGAYGTYIHGPWLFKRWSDELAANIGIRTLE